MAYPYDMYAEMIKMKFNKKYLEKEEKDYLLNFADSSLLSSSKKIYYYGLLYFKRFYPIYFIRLIITNKVKKVLKNENAPKNIQILYKEIAEIIFYSAMGTYSKSKDVKKLSY
jgi:hypothetical protein